VAKSKSTKANSNNILNSRPKHGFICRKMRARGLEGRLFVITIFLYKIKYTTSKAQGLGFSFTIIFHIVMYSSLLPFRYSIQGSSLIACKQMLSKSMRQRRVSVVID